MPSDVQQQLASAPAWTDLIDNTDVVSITGRRRHGKSVCVYFLQDLLADHYGLKKYAWGIPPTKQQFFSEEIEHFDVVEDIEQMTQSVIALDEIHQIFTARRSMSDLNQTISQLMTFSGQRNQILLLATLNNALIDIDTFRITNPVLVYKRVGVIQACAERTATRSFTNRAAKAWQQIPHGKKGTELRALESQLSYVVSEEYEGWMVNPKPHWWTEEASEMHNPDSLPVIPEETILEQYRGEYEAWIYAQVMSCPLCDQGRKAQKLHKTYPIQKYYLQKILPLLTGTKV